MEVRFVVIAPPPARKAYKVRLPILVGRGEEAKFRIQQDSVSRRHCEFTLDDGIVTVTDLGSTNGTVVDGRKIAAHTATAVSNGAEVRIGGTLLRVEYAATSVQGSTVHDDTAPLPAEAASGDEPTPDQPGVETPTVESPAPEAPDDAPAFPDVEAAPAAFPDVDAAAAAAPEGAFPEAAEAAPPAAAGFDFLASDSEPPPAADDKLDDFFKSLS